MPRPTQCLALCALIVALIGFFVPSLLAARVEKNVFVPMRDGVRLMADVYRPDARGSYPVLVTRTPYGRPGAGAATPYVKAGYIVVSQDARGRYDSEGEFISLIAENTHEAEDGYDTVEWAARLPESSGKVGTFGVSYNAFVQWRLAALRPPSLVAMAASSIPARMTDLEGPGTIRPGRRLKWYHGTISPDLRRHHGGPGPYTRPEASAMWDFGEKQYLWFLPWMEIPDSFWGSAGEAEAVRAWLKQPSYDPWRFDEAASKITVPNICFVGWYDHCNGAIDIHNAVVARGATAVARRNQRLIIGPWPHGGAGQSKVGEIDFGQDAAVNMSAEQIRWFDHWLKGADNGVEKDPPVRIFTMGRNQWRDERAWPVTDVTRSDFFLSSGGKANTPAGDGRLSATAPARVSSDRYRYDPRDPVPSLWTADLKTIPAEQGPLRHRRDILVYQSEPLGEPIEVTGYPEVELFAASSAPDTDFFARLIDVAPDGKAVDVANGMVRARYRDSLRESKFIRPGQTVRYTLRLGPTSIEFGRGHRIRLDVTSSDFPNYDRNHNTAADPNIDVTLVVAEQTVFHGGAERSRLIVPVVSRNAGQRERSRPAQ